MDLSVLQRQIQIDLSSNRTPLLVIADIGASLCGYVDNLMRMHEICKANNLWMHATGHGLAALVCSQGPGVISSLVDSITLSLGSWLGIPSLPITLLHRQLHNSALNAFDQDPILSRRLNSLALWTSLQAMGRDAISERIHVAFQTCSILFEMASDCEGIKVVSRPPGAQSGKSLSDVINKPLDVNLLFETAAPVVVFQFDGSVTVTATSAADNDTSRNSDIKALEKVSNASYFDRLNSWLGQILQRDCPNFDFEIIEHATHGTCIRYCPLELSLGEQPPNAENLENLAQSLETHVDILRATIKHKATFMYLVENSDVLRLVNLPEWAGMGGVRFVPDGWESLLTDQAKTELNKLNADLVESLKATDNAFSLCEGPDGLICVRFGMVTHETDVDELLDLVVSVGRNVQENSRVLDTMSEIVKRGIEAATADLQRESDEKQAMGRDAISERIHVAFQTCSILFEMASECEGIKVVSRPPGAQSGKSLSGVINKPLDVNLLFETAAPVVVFQFDGSVTVTSAADNDTSRNSDIKALEKVSNASYFDRLNSWLGQILQRDCPNIDFEIIEHATHGTCIRYCPLELSLGEQPPTAENLENLAQSLETHVDILRATIKHKATFMYLVENSDVLRLVNLPEWAGMGGVRFVPDGWESLLTDQAKTELNKLNADLVESLKATDNAFSLCEGPDGLICVRFGMVTHETDVDELLDLVVSVGRNVQENSRVLDTMSEIVKRGIEAATADLQRESDEKLWQEGILRHVPVVGRVVNWWSPPSKESGIKGRCLNLTQGVVESTENIYKYHMQMSGTHNQLPANKSPPTPMVQTPVINPTNTVPPVFPGTSGTSNNSPTSQAAATPSEEATTTTPTKTAGTAAVGGEAATDAGHNRTVSQSSVASSVPELVAINNSAINNISDTNANSNS